ncbi:MAG: FAD-binding protein [Cytophagales bacterium]|nr:FAD-binding protein [Cytophagales bacterium]
MIEKLQELGKSLEGDFYTDSMTRVAYATDASVYREMPLAVARPRNTRDLEKLIKFAKKFRTSLIPRTAGTSLAGQVVGSGIVVDVSKYMTKILEVNKEEKWVRVQPGVIRDDLNKYLKSYGLFFAPETSTANRCMIGGMVGNNSCGSHSVIYGTTRDHLLELKTLLSDGTEAHFKELTNNEFEEKLQLENLEGDLYRHFEKILSDSYNQNEIRKEFPKPEINRRNTGYAIDILLESAPFTEEKESFNFCKLLAGSEGTLAFMTEIKINLVDLPPKEKAVVAIHSNTINDSLKANRIALSYKPGASELMDKIILDCTKENKNQAANRFFIEGDPAGVLCVEFERETEEEIEELCTQMIAEIKEAGFGYHFPIIWGAETTKVWNLRKAGLGLLANIPGDPKAVACIEDTCVTTDDLPDFIEEFDGIMDKYGKESVYYAHAGDGTIHLRPVLDLKKTEDRQLFFDITNDVATLVKKYNGSMSSEHGDGRVRGEFIEKMIGSHNFKLVESVKGIWDPQNIFNPGKIVDTPKMNEYLRYDADMKTPEFDTMLDFSDDEGILRLAEKCNGTGLCRKTHLSGGTMCPSYMATKNESATTRARANVLREFLTRSEKENPFDHEEIKEVMDLCLSCKGCKSDCPSNVDVAALKTEFLHQYYKSNGIPFRAKQIAEVAKINEKFSSAPWLYNLGAKMPIVNNVVKAVMGVSQKRDLPLLYKTTLRKWYDKNKSSLEKGKTKRGKVHFFADEVINFNDVPIGIIAIQLLTKLGYEVVIPKHVESGRPAMSKGVLDYAKDVATENVKLLKSVVTEEAPLIGVEPSAILSFRDEYPKLVDDKESAKALAKNAFLIDEFIAQEIEKGNISADEFTDKAQKIKLHGHCHQKALSSVNFSKTLLSLPKNYEVEVIPSGCCGMSGSFGYDADKYSTSMQIGELVLFPAVREAGSDTFIAAPGTSCRHQIKDGTGRQAMHPVEILYSALI